VTASVRRAVARLWTWVRTEWAIHRKVHLIDMLLLSQRDGLLAERRACDLKRRLELRIWMDVQARKQRDELEHQVKHWIEQTIRQEAIARAAIDDRDEAISNALRLEGEVKELEDARDELIGIADGLRAELNLPRVTVTTGVKGKARR
jgi:hypothetical protein